MNRPQQYWTAGILSVVMFAAPNAYAGNDALLQLLEVLHDNGTINDEAYNKLREAAAVGEPGGAGHAKQEDTAERAREQEQAVRVELEGRKLRIESADERFEFRLGGRLMADAAHYDEDINELGSGTEMRRVRLSWDARLWRNWELNAAMELTGDPELKSTYIEYTGFPGAGIQFGNIKEPVTMEELSSSKYTTFMERAMLTEMHPGRNVGLGGSRAGDGWGFQGGVFAGGEDGEDEQDEGYGLTGRFFYTPWQDANRVAHLGLSASYRELGDSHSIRFRARPESHVTGTRLIDTGVVEGVDDAAWLGLEAALAAGPLSLQGEYLSTRLGRPNDPSDLGFDGWYAYASWFPTGESRSYDAEDGDFGRITPHRSVGEGGWGAFELGARFSHLDLTDDDVIGGSEDNLTLGLNWYATPNVRFMANYIKVLDVDRPGSEFDGDEPTIFQIRGQADF